MKAGIYSEQPEVLLQITEWLKEFFEDCCIEYELYPVECYDGVIELFRESYLNAFVVHLDGAAMDVWEVVDLIRCTDEGCLQILLSEDPGNAIRGYRAGAVDYLAMPLAEGEFKASMGRMMKKTGLFSLGRMFVKLKCEGVWIKVALEHIAYVESSGHSLIFSLTDGKEIRMMASFRDYEPVLERSRYFFRCHKSFMVNLKEVESMKPSCFRLKDGRTVNISRRYKQESKSYYIHFMMEKYEEMMLKEQEAKEG